MNHWTDFLQGIACDEGVENGKPYATFADWWIGTLRGDYMYWVLCHDGIGYTDDRKMSLLACRRVRETPVDEHRTVWDLYTNDKRVRHAIEVTEQYMNGELTKEQMLAIRNKEAWDTAGATAGAMIAIAEGAAKDVLLAQRATMIREIIPAEEIAPLFEQYLQRQKEHR